MNTDRMKAIMAILFLVILSTSFQGDVENRILSHRVDLKKSTLQFYWKNEQGEILRSFDRLNTMVKTQGKELMFAMNGGMFNPDHSPTGLYIEDGRELAKINRRQKGSGNFLLQPNGVFFFTKEGKAAIVKTEDFETASNIAYATQSGPMLLINRTYHPAFNKGSSNLHIRNGVGILPDGSLLFAMSKERINFYDFASFFKSQGCENALYLDGAISKTYLPEKGYNNTQTDFGVMIGETKKP